MFKQEMVYVVSNRELEDLIEVTFGTSYPIKELEELRRGDKKLIEVNELCYIDDDTEDYLTGEGDAFYILKNLMEIMVNMQVISKGKYLLEVI
jgi:hypothetical protein